jgi:mono/diheme cytochrome c family protein
MPSCSTPYRLVFALGALLLPALMTAKLVSAGPEPSLPPAAARRIDFVKDVRPIFAASCFSCHGEKKRKGDLRLDRKASALGSGAILPGKSADSPLIQRVASLESDTKMPPKGPALSAAQIGILRAWIDQGAVWPDDTDTKAAQHWAYQPLRDPPIPSIKDRHWTRTPLDAFVLAKLEAKRLSPSPPADRRTLLRRVTFDLLGLPPTPAEMEAFLADRSPDAYEKVVDRLLASPHYGERWARHWMDVVHFAETHGHDQDVPRDNAWPYRDYLIRSFNEDKPYGRFVEEQLAGDVLWPDDPQAIVATGFIAAGPWDESSLRDIREDSIDRKIGQYLDRDDMVTTTMSSFASATVHCARCHNHKFDPISQKDYYRLQAVFAGVDRAERDYDADPQVARTRRALLRRKAELESGTVTLTAETRAEVARWEKTLAERHTAWTALDPATVTCAKGSTPSKQADHSICFGGPRPEIDTYTIEAHSDLQGITGVRLEVLTDASLPHQGPGRQDNGNLHLTEFHVRAAPRGKPNAGKAVALQNPSADFNQDGWTVGLAIDGKPKTAWGIYPQVGKPHVAVFEFAEPAGFDGGTTLTFVLEQNHGGGHLIGRLRLSVTTAARPLRLDPLPDAIARIVAVPAERRSAAQEKELAQHILIEKIAAELAALPPPQLVYAGTSDFKPQGSFKPAKGCRAVHVLRRGDIKNAGEAVGPGGLSCLPGLEGPFHLEHPDNEGSRRVALAKWLGDPRNVLTWRSIVNRVWHYHFGRGIVATPNDFGRMGAAPTHPELLDWLALHFHDSGGSLKKLHRLIVTSAVYMQSSRHRPNCARVDGDNQYLWRMNRNRLDAESVRDAVLGATGKLDAKMGGPSIKQFAQSPGIHRTPKVDYRAFDVDSPGSYRRSVYRFLFRTLPDPFMDTLDCPDASQFTPVRSSSVTALQALAMLNDRFMVRQSEHFAARVRTAGPDLGKQIEMAYLLALGRPPSADETTRLAAYARKHGMANVCRLIFNSNEFMFVP